MANPIRKLIRRLADVQPIVAGYEEPLGYRQITVTNAATSLHALLVASGSAGGLDDFVDAKGAPPKSVLLTPAAAIRFRDDGTNPTTAIGYPIAANAEVEYTGNLASSDTNQLMLIAAANTVVDLYFKG